MDWRAFEQHGSDRGPAFYGTALEYGHYLWLQGRAARAILCLDRALGADLRPDDPIVSSWPPPYESMAWILAHTPEALFVGNPRVHFQHYAGRMNAPRREQRQARAWACWLISRRILPHLPGDPRHEIREPTEDEITLLLRQHGFPGEAAQWHRVLASCVPRRPGG